MATNGVFSSDTTGLPAAAATELVHLAHGDRFSLTVESAVKEVASQPVRLLAYNRSVPGPTLRLQEGSEAMVEVTNHGDIATTVHWHGLRLQNRYDGTELTQHPVPVGGTYEAIIATPDPGVYWYHPHLRTDYGLEMGLYGGVIVDPSASDYWPACHRDVLLTLDDILIEDGAVAAFDRDEPSYAAMGRFGNVMLVNGSDDLALTAAPGEVVRFYLVNTANTRVFKVAIPGTRMKLVGRDSGRLEHEQFVDDVVLGPSERAVVDVLFAQAGALTLEHRTPGRTYALAAITVAGEPAQPSLAADFDRLRTNQEMVELRTSLARYLDSDPDKTLVLTAVMDFAPEGADRVLYACPMHPEVVSDSPGHCPKCAMKLLPAQLIGKAQEHSTHSDGTERHDHAHGTADGIEWEDDMVEVNRITTRVNMRWKLVDAETNAVNNDIDWRFRVGDKVKIRLVNELAGDHPMHHPFHVHAAGRFVVLNRDGVPEANLAWKDTVLLRTGETVDILLDVTNAGHWMAHCHIAEHHENGMMFTFEVSD